MSLAGAVVSIRHCGHGTVRTMRRLVATLLLGLPLLTPGPARAISVQEAILRAKPAVALVRAEVRAEVSLNCGTGPTMVQPAPFVEFGTGWFVDGRGWLITNGHVVDPAYRIPAYVTYELKKKAIDQACVEPAMKARGATPGQRPEVEERLRRDATERALDSAKVTATSSITVVLSNGTKLPAQVVKFSPSIVLDANGQPSRKDSGRDLALVRVSDGTYPALTPSDHDVKVGDPAHVIGFPDVVQSHELLGGMIEASVTTGAISGFQQDAIGQDVIQTDASASHGNSGGPAINNDAEVVGVLTFVSLSSTGGVVQGFNFLIPAKDVRAFLADTAVTKPGDSKFTRVWAAGLDALFNERYRAAFDRFSDVDHMLPNVPDVKHVLAEADRKVKNPPPRPFPWAWIAMGVSLVSVGAYGGMFARRWWKNRYRILPAQVIGLMEKGFSPVLLDVRSATDFETSPLKLPGAVRLSPEDAAAGRFDFGADPTQTIVAYCTTPEERTSAHVAQLLRARGYRHVRILKGGLGGWTNARLPVEAKSSIPSVGLELYKNLTLGELERRRFKREETIFREGDDARGEAYIVHSGTLEIRKQIDGAERVLRTYGEGELLGEMALIRKAARSADAVATSDVELLVVKNERLDWLMRNRPQLTMEILKRLSDYVVQTDSDRATSVR
jgi:S1-C subfamily serine protease/rhodanese-related sulfurtransferase